MIVICTRCQAKFRVADDKIGPRGAKVRCSRCQTVFLVHPDLGTIPAQEPAPSRPEPPAAPPPAAPPPLPPPAADPFGAAPAPDPFAAPPPDPFAAADPFASRGQGDPFAPEPGHDPLAGDPGERQLPVTDLSDLGIGAPSGAPPAPEEPPAFDPSASLAAHPFPDDDGLSLEDRTTPPPRPVASHPSPFPPGEDFLGGPDPADPFAAGASFDPGPEGYELGAQEGLALAGERPAEPEPSPPPPPPPAPARPPPSPREERAPQPRAPADAVAAVAAQPDRIPGHGASRLRALAVNAVGLAAVLLAALAILAIWRAGGRLDAASLRPAALLGLASGEAADAPFITRGVTSGLYERDRAAPVLFVRGAVVSRLPGAVPGVKVGVEVVREGRVIARGEAVAGALPTPEELHGARDAAALAGVQRAAEARATAEVRPGVEVPFLVVMADHPYDLHGASLRLAVREAGGEPAAAAPEGARP